MPMHVVKVNPKTLDFIQRVNGGIRPTDAQLNTMFIYSDRLDDDHDNHFLTKEEFYRFWRLHECPDDNCNVVELRPLYSEGP